MNRTRSSWRNAAVAAATMLIATGFVGKAAATPAAPDYFAFAFDAGAYAGNFQFQATPVSGDPGVYNVNYITSGSIGVGDPAKGTYVGVFQNAGYTNLTIAPQSLSTNPRVQNQIDPGVGPTGQQFVGNFVIQAGNSFYDITSSSNGNGQYDTVVGQGATVAAAEAAAALGADAGQPGIVNFGTSAYVPGPTPGTGMLSLGFLIIAGLMVRARKAAGY